MEFFRQLKRGIVLSLFRIFFGAIKVKILASIFGVNGIGELSFLLQLQLLSQTFLSMGLAVVIINIARPFILNNNFSASSEVLGSGILITFLNSLFLVTLFGFLFYSSLLVSLISIDPTYIWLIIFASLFSALASVLWESVCFLLNHYSTYVKVNSILAFFDTAFIIIAAFKMGFQGVLIAILLSAIFQFIIYFFFLFRISSVRVLLSHLAIKKRWIKPLYTQAFRLQFISILVLVGPLLARAYLLRFSGSVANGYLQVATSLSSYLLPVFMNGVWGHLHPLVAAHGDGDISRNGLRTTICYAFPIIILLCLSVALSVPFLINYLYTSEFIAAQETILVYFLAEPLYVTISIISAYLIALQKYKACFIMHFSYYVILLLFVYFGSSLLDSLSYALGHLIGTYVIALLYFYSFWKQRLFSSRQILQFFLLILIYDTCLTFDIINSDHTSFNIRLSFICYTLCILFIFKKYFQVLKYRPFIIFKLHE